MTLLAYTSVNRVTIFIMFQIIKLLLLIFNDTVELISLSLSFSGEIYTHQCCVAFDKCFYAV